MAGGAAMALTALLSACTPLPGDTVDPVFLRYRGAAATPSRASSVGESTPRTTASSPVTHEAPPPPRPIGNGTWAGWYRDSRGAGELTLSLVRNGSGLTGKWSVRTGGGGPVIGSVERGDARLQLRMENTAPGCPGTFEGWAEPRGSSLIGAYHGTDCEGIVADGWLELNAK